MVEALVCCSDGFTDLWFCKLQMTVHCQQLGTANLSLFFRAWLLTHSRDVEQLNRVELPGYGLC